MGSNTNPLGVPGAIPGNSIEIINDFTVVINGKSYPLSAVTYYYSTDSRRLDLIVEIMDPNIGGKMFVFHSELLNGMISDQLGAQMVKFVNDASIHHLPQRDLTYFKKEPIGYTPQARPQPVAAPMAKPPSKAKVIGVIIAILLCGALVTFGVIALINSTANVNSTYTVTYDGNGGYCEITDSTEYKSGDTVQIKYTPEPKRDGYQFLGWSTSSYAITPEFQKGKDLTGIIQGNVKLYAVWSKEIRVIYIVDGDKTKVVDDHKYKIGETATLKDYTGKKANYHFYGWKNTSISTVHEPGYQTTLYGTETYEAYWLPICTYSYTLSNSIADGFEYQIDGYSYTYTETPKDGYKFVLATFTVKNVNVDKSISVNSTMLKAELSNSTTVDTSTASYSYCRYVAHDPDSPIQLNKGGSVTYHCIYEIPKNVQILKLKPDVLHEGGYYEGYWMEMV